MENRDCKVMLIGIDGATFRIIEPLVKAGKLPTIGRLMREGVHGELRSTVPVVSPVAWTSFMTGKNPGKHHIYDFMHKLPQSYRFRINSALDRKAKAFWVTLSEFGKKVCVAGVTATYPPDPVNGLMVSGLGTPMNPDCIFTHPAALSGEITETIGQYQIIHKKKHNLDTSGGRVAFIEEMNELIEYRVKLAEFLMRKEKHDFRMFFFIDTDGISHNFWKHMDPSMNRPDRDPRHENAIYSIYEKIDEALGKLIALSDNSTNVVLMSDHGFGPLKRTVALNVWLWSKGLLVYKYGRRRETVQKLFGRVVSKVVGKKGEFKLECNADEIDWSKTKAYYNGSVGNIFINLEGRDPFGIVKPEEYEQVRAMIAAGLMDMVDPGNGEKAIEKVYRREEVFQGEYLAEAPDLVVMFKSGYGVFSGSSRQRVERGAVFEDSRHWTGEHEPEGIFIARGPDFRKNATILNANIIDVAPTLLYLLGVPIPAAMDGKVLQDAIAEDFLKKNAVVYSGQDENHTTDDKGQGLNDDESEIVKGHLRDLGYIE
jgi:predicted AlkP superfamily phosphohydrolase/phosphomutase